MLPTTLLRARRRAGLRIILRSFGSELEGAMSSASVGCRGCRSDGWGHDMKDRVKLEVQKLVVDATTDL